MEMGVLHLQQLILLVFWVLIKQLILYEVIFMIILELN
jgi:hypothetical protein